VNDGLHDWQMKAYLLLAAAGGSIVALFHMKWKEMRPSEVIFTLFSGFLVAVFAIPYLAKQLGFAMETPQDTAAVTFIGGTCWNSFIPLALSWAKARAQKLFGEEGRQA